MLCITEDACASSPRFACLATVEEKCLYYAEDSRALIRYEKAEWMLA